MSDYIFMLESHLNPDQNRVVEEVQAAAAQSQVNVFLTGGAMRDMLGGFRVRDLDFSVEGQALKVAKTVAERAGAQTLHVDEHRRTAELLFPGGVTAQIALSRQEKHGKPGTRPQVTAATIQEDLRGRDFTVNAIALSLNKASRGLLLDPMNGLADLERQELRLVSPYGFYDDPVRLLRLIRFQVRFGFAVEERTRSQAANAREAQVERQIAARELLEELRHIAEEDNPWAVVKLLDEAKLLELFLPELSGAKSPLASLAKLEKAAQTMPGDTTERAWRFGPVLFALTEQLTAREKQALIKATGMTPAEAGEWMKLEGRGKKLETALKSPALRKPSQVYKVLAKAAPDEVLFVLYRSAVKPVQERIRNYYQKFLPMAQEIPESEFAGIEHRPGTPKYVKAQEEILYKALDRRPPKVVEAEVEVPVAAPEPLPGPMAVRGRGVR
jgi:tRNA nucleotidyltransferase (CCA-adding enzyme)